VELLMAITLMGLVVGIAVPRIGAVRDTYFAAESAKSVASALRTARIGAIRERTTVILAPRQGDDSVLEERRLPSRSWARSDVAGLDLGTDPTAVWDAKVVRLVPLSGKFELSVPGEGILFFADGSSSGGEITVHAENGEVQHRFHVDALTGEVFIQ
jgi:Tfp pilus assembly protein FimT